jgi:hypothetical protein
MTNIEELSGVIRELHGATATHRESVPVKEIWQGKTIWDGVVEVFDLQGHPKTHRAYAWSHDTDDPKHPKRHVTVLHIPPAISPQTAVQAAIMQEIQSHARTQA